METMSAAFQFKFVEANDKVQMLHSLLSQNFDSLGIHFLVFHTLVPQREECTWDILEATSAFLPQHIVALLADQTLC